MGEAHNIAGKLQLPPPVVENEILEQGAVASTSSLFFVHN
jgi:hypothetical protein